MIYTNLQEFLDFSQQIFHVNYLITNLEKVTNYSPKELHGYSGEKISQELVEVLSKDEEFEFLLNDDESMKILDNDNIISKKSQVILPIHCRNHIVGAFIMYEDRHFIKSNLRNAKSTRVIIEDFINSKLN